MHIHSKKSDVLSELDALLNKAAAAYNENFGDSCYFERALFISWYCSKADCKFCYMSTQKGKIKNVPLKLAKRRPESLVTEALLCKMLGWNIEFLSGGYDAYSDKEFLEIVKYIYSAYGRKLWLNTGLLDKNQLSMLKPYIEGISGSVETLDPELHDKMCPSKPLEPIFNMLELSKSSGLKTGITIIIGLGETIDDFKLLKNFITKHDIDRITFYALNPHDSDYFKKGPESEYYARWIALTRIHFPKIEIIAGSWVDRLDEVHLLLEAGANNITKFPATSMFNNRFAHQLEDQIRKSGRRFSGTLTKLPDIDWHEIIDDLDSSVFEQKFKQKLKIRMDSYLKMLRKEKK